MKIRMPVFLLLGVVLAACGQNDSNDVVDSAVYAGAIANPARLEGDRDRDASRKPAAVLEFLGIAPGDRVLEMFAGGGYYTELLSHVVGTEGSVVAHMNTPLHNFARDQVKQRHADNRLPNVEILTAENNELALQPGQFDAVTLILNYHDIYWESDQYQWVRIDGPALLAELYKGLKPGGVLGIVDHDAEPGSPPETGGTIHRIAKDVVIAEVEAAGFTFDAESDVLRNPADDHSKNVFDPEIRGKTDRFVLRFRKPAA